MRRFNGFVPLSGLPSDVSPDCGCDRVFASAVAVSLSGDMMLVPISKRFLQGSNQYLSLVLCCKSTNLQSKCLISNSQGKTR